MTCATYFQDILPLHRAGALEVDHDPMSNRYQRAMMYLDAFISNAECIGCYEKMGDASKYVEVVAWQGPDSGRFHRDDKGTYGVFRINYEATGDGKYTPSYSELFAYYDDNPTADDTGNHAVNTYEDAISLMDSFGKYEIC